MIVINGIEIMNGSGERAEVKVIHSIGVNRNETSQSL